MKKILTLLFLFFTFTTYSATTLTQGDIAFICMNLDNTDSYTFILLKDIDGTTTINFTDCGWVDGSSSFICNNGDVNGWTWTSGSGLIVGQTITITLNGPGLSTTIGSVSGAIPVLSSIGDQILAYQGSSSSPTHIAGINSNEPGTDADWNGGVDNNQQSALPNVLTNGVNAIRLHNGGSEVDNWQYNCAVTSGDVATVRNAINNISNWVNNNSSEYSPADPGCTWAITVLPIHLISFELKVNDKDKVNIKWRTASEINNDFFTIEKSRNGIHWDELAKIAGSGTSLSELDYQIFDENPYYGISYYRLKQTDFDGKYEYSNIESISLKTRTNQLKIFPNPTNSIVTVKGLLQKPEFIKVYNVLGENINNKINIIEIDETQIQIDFSSEREGVYLLITNQESFKIIKK